ncbi:hypothetical protein [Streptomyces sp. NBC_00724]|uniref:hypothetical protein n=1 Tax=Streptomyces sp. NBC_00724 TaxID=2975812 RepID=UPI002ED63614|nr:hypothetical protein OHB17_04440 [Streptomyces sp. NBC_00724]
MKQLTMRISATATTLVIAGVAVLGVGDAASAATPAVAHVQGPAASVKADDYRWDHGVSYLIEQGYSWDEIRGWHRDDCVSDATRYGHGGGHSYRWDDNGRGWKFDRSYRYDWNRYEHDGRDRHHHDRNHSDR